MHPISDKELDKLFQQRFEDVEIQPSADLWSKIELKMDHKDQVSKSFPVFWMAAASVIALIGAGLWLYRPVEVIKLQGTQQLVQQAAPESITDIGTDEPIMEHVHADIKGFDFTKLEAAQSKEATAGLDQESKARVEDHIQEEPKRELLAANNVPKRTVVESPSTSNEVKVPRYSGDQSRLDVTQPDMIANADLAEEGMILEAEPVSARKIRSVGSLVNYVISKVDRRDDKIIEFKDGDEGSEVSGINLGLIKLKSRIK